MTDASGTITYAQTYDPYGVTTSTAGPSQTDYGYTGEFTADDMVYLRARQYAPGMGRFLTRDTWEGIANNPLSLNRWNYVSGNPINRTDPSGLCWYPDLQTGGTLIDRLTPNPNLCPWFIEGVKQMGWTIPYDARPDNWADYIPESERWKFDHSDITYIGAPSDNAILWYLLRYTKHTKLNRYQKITVWDTGKGLYNTQTLGPSPVKGVIAITGTSRSECSGLWGPCSEFSETELTGYAKIGVGEVVTGGVQGEWNISTGEPNSCMYVELLGGGLNIDPNFGSPMDIGLYVNNPVTGQGAETGVSIQAIRQWQYILATAKTIHARGGYDAIGRDQFGYGYVFDGVVETTTNKIGLLNRWSPLWKINVIE